MFIETVTTPGLAHNSYVVGAGRRAVVIDPRLDIGVYLRCAEARGARIEAVLETHRNEDLWSGAARLAERVGAQVLHGEGLDWRFGSTVKDGDGLDLGDLQVRILATPGHTDESLTFVAIDRETGDSPVAAFTGDALFVGAVGRADFYPERREEVAGALYDSLHEQILSLGDQALVYPAHGSGSACGGGLATRALSTVGYERRHNRWLGMDRAAFVAEKSRERHPMPPYFSHMERLNLHGKTGPARLPPTRLLPPEEVRERRDDGAHVVDVRSHEAWLGGSVPGSLCLPVDMIASWAGWLLDPEDPVVLVAADAAQAREATRHFARIGLLHVVGMVQGGVAAWETAGLPVQTIRAVGGPELLACWKGPRRSFTLLDVRKDDEWAQGHVPESRHRPLSGLAGKRRNRLDGLPTDRPLVTFCGSGRRAAVAASLLAAAGHEDVRVALGSWQAWQALDGPCETEDDG